MPEYYRILCHFTKTTLNNFAIKHNSKNIFFLFELLNVIQKMIFHKIYGVFFRDLDICVRKLLNLCFITLLSNIFH